MARNNSSFLIVWSFLSALLVAGCVPSGRHVDAGDSLRTAIELERNGDLSGAIDNLQLVLTLTPENPAAREQLMRLLQQRDDLAKRHYQAGLEQKRNDPAAARREFLAALRSKNDYPAALAELRALHLTATEGRLVKATPNTSDLTYPEEGIIDAVPFDDAVGLYDQGAFAAALQQFKALRSKQQSPEVKRYISLCYYKLGIEAMQRKEYQRSLELFGHVDSKFERTGEYLKKIHTEIKNLAETHYKQGLKWYREQQLNEAIAEWRKVLELDAGHIKAREYIDKANKLLDALKK